MKKEFVPYEQALALKELGFDEPCFGYYLDNKLNIFHSTSVKDRINSKTKDIFSSDVIVAPLYQQAFRFIRENHNLYSTIALISNSTKDRAYMGMIDYIYPHKAIMDFEEYETHEEAEFEYLKKLIEIVKEK
jgi:hypothetical protein